MEHARWFPHCAYVRKVKGEDYIELVRLSAEQDRLDEVWHVHVQSALIGRWEEFRSNHKVLTFFLFL